MQFSIGDWAIEVETDFVFQVTGVSGRGRKALVFAGTDKTLYQCDCTPWYPAQDDYEDVRRIIALADDTCADEIYKMLQHCFVSKEDKTGLWGALSEDQRLKVKRLSAIAVQKTQVHLVAA